MGPIMTNAARKIEADSSQKTEWYVSEGSERVVIREKDTDAIIATMEDGGHATRTLIRFPQQQAYAAQIVKSVECHDELVEAAKAGLEFIRIIYDCVPDWRKRLGVTDGMTNGYENKLRAAIAEAEGR